jgi:hypothetical protein
MKKHQHLSYSDYETVPSLDLKGACISREKYIKNTAAFNRNIIKNFSELTIWCVVEFLFCFLAEEPLALNVEDGK